jgi:transglutaminase-like putative cysteine protease
VTWAQDVYGNAVATATFQTMAEHLVIDSFTELQLGVELWPVFDIAASAIFYPFLYTPNEWDCLGALAVQQYSDPAGRLREWAHAFVRGKPTDSLSLLKDLNAGVSRWICYQSREDEGTQSPIETLERGWGACRDFAVLFVEAARCLGFGARVVSGSLQSQRELDMAGRSWIDPRLGRGLCARRRMGHLRSHEPQRWRLQSDPCRCRTTSGKRCQ